MPGYTSPLNIPYPLPSEPPNGSSQMLALADKVDDLIVAEQSARAAGDAALTTRLSSMTVSGAPSNPKTVEAHLADVYTKIPTARVKWGTTSATADGNGRIIVTHAAGWLPSLVAVTPVVPGSTRRMIALTVDGDSINTSSFALWAWDVVAGAWAASQVVRVQWVLRD